MARVAETLNRTRAEASRVSARCAPWMAQWGVAQRLLNWKRRRAPARPYFLRSTLRESRVR